MSLIIFIEISIFSRGCYEHATPPYSTESPESRDKVSRRDIATSVTMPAESGTRVNVRGQFVYALRKIKHGNTPLLLSTATHHCCSIFAWFLQRTDGLRRGFDKPCHSVISILCHHSCDDFCQSFNDMVISLWYHQSHGARASIEGGFFESKKAT